MRAQAANERSMSMAASMFKGGVDRVLEPGETFVGHWNHAAPAVAVWSVNPVPKSNGSTPTGFNEDARLEVTRFWRRLLINEGQPSSETTIEHEIYYEIKNIGTKTAKFEMCFSAIW
jgi:hypothetical protein